MANVKLFCKMCDVLPPRISWTSYFKRIHSKVSTKTKIKSANEKRIYEKISDRLKKCIISDEEIKHVQNVVPKHLLREITSAKCCYLISRSVADRIVPLIGKDLSDSPIVIEVNPGLGFITEKLLDNYVERIKVYECTKGFVEHFNELNERYSNRIEYRYGNFFGLAHVLQMDSFQNTSEYEKMLSGVQIEPWGNKFCAAIIGAMPTLNFIFHYIKCIIFNSHLVSLGRINLYLFMPVQNYNFISNSNRKNENRFVRMSSLFELLFDHEVIAEVDNAAFVPWIKCKKKDKDGEDFFCVVNVRPKLEFPCSAEHLPLLRHFLSPQYVRNNLCVVPTFEQLIPHSGIWVITGQDPPGTNSDTLPVETDEPLPRIDAFTKFGELTLRQKVTIFKRLISWPEFEQCHLNASLESSFASSNDAVDIKETNFEYVTGTDVTGTDDQDTARYCLKHTT